MNLSNLWTLEEVAAYLSVPPKTLYRWNYQGTGPRRLKIGRHVRYRPEDVEAWLDQHQVADRTWV